MTSENSVALLFSYSEVLTLEVVMFFILQLCRNLLSQVEFDLAALLHIDQVPPVVGDPELLQQTALHSAGLLLWWRCSADVTTHQTDKTKFSLSAQIPLPSQGTGRAHLSSIK